MTEHVHEWFITSDIETRAEEVLCNDGDCTKVLTIEEADRRLNEYETLKTTNAALLDVVRDCVNFLADLNTTSLSPEMLERGISLHKRAYTAHSKAKEK